MSDKMHVEVIAPTRVAAKLEAAQVNLPAHWGYLTILPKHAPFITELSVGKLTISGIAGGKPDLNYFISGGFLQVADDKLVILADIVEKPEEIDRVRVERALQRAKERLAKPLGSVDYRRANLALGRAQKRLEFLDMIAEVGARHPH